MKLRNAALVLALLGGLLVRSAGAEEEDEPIARLKRELSALRNSRAQVIAKIDEASEAIRKDAPGFYKAHEADCEKRAQRADGSFDFVYRPAREWIAQKKRLSGTISDKERDLALAYDGAIARLEELDRHLLARQDAWGEAINRLHRVEKDLAAGEEEWRKTMIMAGWDFANELTPAMREGLDGLGIRLVRPPAGSFWSKVSPELRSKLHHRISTMETASGMLSHSAKALFAGVDASKEKDAGEAGKKTVEASQEAFELFADILKETAIGTTKEELAEFAQVRAAVSGYAAVVRAGATFAAGGKLDDETKIQLSNAGVSIVKFAGTFNPLVHAAVLGYGALAAGAETGIAASAWWTNWSAGRTNLENLDWARRMAAAAREDEEKVSARLKAYRDERAALQEGGGH